MIIIADSSALVALAICQAHTLLDELFDEVRVPQAVYEERRQTRGGGSTHISDRKGHFG